MSTVTQSPRYTEISVSEHAYDRWTERSAQPKLNPRAAWLEAIPVEYPSINPPAKYARYHQETDLVLLVAGDDTLITCIPLSQRSVKEQQYVLSQVTDE
ncbi:hypothetical protein [Natrinema halophilum]|uniref:RelE toxin-related domain-containing protein n=1 Tax=Natrinema halophilum TaxID=1699371 RepID=A0A7D5KWQ7_9EURY|nr:hypothetical protein [Natrinema halophilum]QLG47862.1 hypothetical protein HYG82_02885 [Natrinema halophilum]